MSKTAVIQELEAEQLKADIPNFKIGDSLRVNLRIIEGEKERVQAFQGTVIARKGGGLSETVTLHRIAYNGGMERVFKLHCPRLSSIEVVRRGRVRQAKLYYLRGTTGKKAKVPELITSKAKRAAMLKKEVAAAAVVQKADNASETTGE
ncbi:MAG: large subunit ribosomal protein L19 [Chlamydiales bacterium]|jgi:large subunit ribosomal protein L19